MGSTEHVWFVAIVCIGMIACSGADVSEPIADPTPPTPATNQVTTAPANPAPPETTTTVEPLPSTTVTCSEGRYRLVDNERELCQDGQWQPSPFEPTTTTAVAAVVGISESVVSAEGWSYLIQISPDPLNPASSPGGCIDTAPPGRTNVRFTMSVTNELDDRPAPWPNMAFTANLVDAGDAVDEAAVDFESSSYRNIEVYPQAGPTPCFLGSTIGPRQDNPIEIEPGRDTRFTITIGQVTDPPPPGLELHVRFDQAGARQEFVATLD